MSEVGPDASNAERMRYVVEEIQVRGRFELIPEFFHPDLVDHPDPATDAPLSHDGVEATLRAFHAAFRDFAADIVRIVSDADHVATYKIFRGVHVAEFAGIPAAGRTLALPVFDLVRFEGGLIVEHWAVADTGELARQLGASGMPS